MGTALGANPDLPQQWRTGGDDVARIPPINWKDKTLASAASMAVVRQQLRRVSRGRTTNPRVHPGLALLREDISRRRALRRYRTWLLAR
jgi:hypothetical protein